MDLLEPTSQAFRLLFSGDPELWRIIWLSLWVSLAAIALVDRLVGEDSELVTVLLGSDARPADTARLREHLGLEHGHVEVEVHEGDQPLYPYLIGVE